MRRNVTKTYSFFPDDVERLSDCASRMGMNESAFLRFSINVMFGHIKAVQQDVSKSLKAGEDYQRVFERRILTDFDHLMSGRGKFGKPKKTLETLKNTQMTMF